MTQPDDSESPERKRKLRGFAIVLLTLVVASMAFRVLIGMGLQHTSLVFVGLPAIIAWLIASAEPPSTASGSVMRTTTLALLIAWIFLGEAFICVLMAAPIFYLVGWFVAWAKGGQDRGRRSGMLAIALVPLALEGTTPALSTSRDREVVVESVVAADIAHVRARLAETPRLDRALPLFFRLGFPTPQHPQGNGLRVGDRRSIHFAHGGHHSGTLSLRIDESTPTLIRFSPERDDSYLTHWLSWRESVVELEERAPGQTRVRWTLRYTRRLDPSWYFDPLERYGVTLAGRYLLETIVESPEGRAP